MRNIKFLFTIIFVITLLSCVFPYDDYDYILDNMSIGIAFPPVADAAKREFSKQHLDALGVSLIRIGEDWSFREPVDDEFYWTPLEERLLFCEKNGYSVLLTIETHLWPGWFAEVYPETVPPLSEFKEYISALLNLYADKIDYIQLGNEWNWEIGKYFFNDENIFIEYNNALYDAVHELTIANRPVVVLGSIAEGGLFALSYDQGLIDNIYFEEQQQYMYTDEDIMKYETESLGKNQALIEKVFSECRFEILDLHFYDDYWNWETYMTAISSSMANSGKTMPAVIASEFGGPNPQIEGLDSFYQARRVISYINTLDAIGIEKAFFFKLSYSDNGPPHYNSYLVNSFGFTNQAYEVIKRFIQSSQTR